MAEAKGGEARVTGTTLAVLLVLAIVLTLVTWGLEKALGLGRFGIEFPLVGFLLGLVVAAAMKPPREAFKTLDPWVPVDASLIILGLLSGYNKLAALGGKAGIIAVTNVIVGLAVGMFLAYKLGLDERFSATFVAGGTICGISASIATGRSVNAEFAHLVIAMLLIAVVGAPFTVAIAGLATTLGKLGGALVGGVVDGTPVVEAIAKGLPEDLRDIALGVKYAQNCLIPIAAVVLAFVVSRLAGIEARLPLAVILMLVGSIIGTFIALPESVAAALKAARAWLLALAMVMAGMATPIEALKKPGVLTAIMIFALIEVLNIIVVACLASLLL